jgi:hypothetical protein
VAPPAAAAKSRGSAATSENPSLNWLPLGWTVWDKYGPWSGEPSPLLFGTHVSNGVPAAGFATPNQPGTSRAQQRANAHEREDGIVQSEKRARVDDASTMATLGENQAEIRFELALNNEIEKRKQIIVERRALWEMADPGREKDEAKQMFLAATNEPMPTRESVAAARAAARAPAPVEPTPAAGPAADESEADQEPE